MSGLTVDLMDKTILLHLLTEASFFVPNFYFYMVVIGTL